MFDVSNMVFVSRTLDHQPAAPSHFVKNFLYGRKVDLRIIFEIESVGVAEVDLTDVVSNNGIQLFDGVASGIENVM